MVIKRPRWVASIATGVVGASLVVTLFVVTSALAAPKPAPAAAPTSAVADTTAPPAPQIVQKPDNPTANQNAHFRFTSAESGVTFVCSLDGGAQPCGHVANYNGLDFGEHCLEVRARDGAGNLSPPSPWCWSVVIQGGFPISGTVAQPFFPGATRPLDLVIGNPYNFTIRVTSVAVTVDDTTSQPGCVGSANLRVTQGLAVAVDVPRNSTRSLGQIGVAQSHWPQLTMPNLSTNQDACKSATFSLTYTGQATKP